MVLFVTIEEGGNEAEIKAMAMEASGSRDWTGVRGVVMLNARVPLFCFWFAGVGGVVAEVAEVEVEVEADPETRTVDVMVPYTVLFLYTVSGLSVTVASLLAVRSNTSVVWISSHCLQLTFAA